MKKLFIYLCLLALGLSSCAKKVNVEKNMTAFLVDYYEVTQEQVDALKTYMTHIPDDIVANQASLKDYYEKAPKLLDIYHIQNECHEKFINRYFNARMYQRYPSLLTNNQANRIEVKDSQFELDIAYDDFAYYIHHTNVDVYYQDDTVKTYQIEGRICIEQDSKLVYSYQVTKDIAFENQDPIDHCPKDG